jgi:hypothetical protein
MGHPAGGGPSSSVASIPLGIFSTSELDPKPADIAEVLVSSSWNGREGRRSVRVRIRTTAAVGLAIALTAAVAGVAGEPDRPHPPIPLGPTEGMGPFPDSFLLAMPDGAVDLIYSRTAPGGAEVARKRTTDNGRTWSAPERIYPMGDKTWGAPFPMRTREGRGQFFWLVRRRTGDTLAVDYFIDIWNVHGERTVADAKSPHPGPLPKGEGKADRALPKGEETLAWSPPKRVFEGYCGSINGWTQLANARILLPFGYWRAGVQRGPPTGGHYVTTVYSDDGGDTWTQSPAKLTAPCYENYNGGNYGACEPCVLQLADGRVWMLIRTQTGVLYESFSPDGAEWSEAKPTRFHTSNSPAALVRLPDGRIVLFWNNCENTSRVEGKEVYTNRDALHAAISSDEGKTWRGCREVYLDPLRHNSKPRMTDRGTAYPFPVLAKDGKILMIAGQAAGSRNLLLVDPHWLEEIRAEDDFSRGLDGWSAFKCHGLPVDDNWRDRAPGPALVDHPTKPGAKALHVRRPDDKVGDEAVWNFPAGRRGKVELSLRLQRGCQEAAVALADRYIQPTDIAGRAKELFRLPITPDGQLPGGARLECGQWYTLALNWDLDRQVCQVHLDGRQVGSLTPVNEDADSLGASYLRLRSTAADQDTAGMLVEWVRAEVE